MIISTRSFGRWSSMVVVCLLLTMFGSRPALAQAPGNQFGAPSIRRPTTSPYLNLFRDNNNNRALNFGLNYQRLVRPEQELRNYSANLNTQIGTLSDRVDSQIAPDGSVTVPGTGHSTSFMNTGGYFSGGGSGSGVRGTGQRSFGGSGGGGGAAGGGYASGANAGAQGRAFAGQAYRNTQQNLYNRGVSQGANFGSRSGGFGAAPGGRQPSR